MADLFRNPGLDYAGMAACAEMLRRMTVGGTDWQANFITWAAGNGGYQDLRLVYFDGGQPQAAYFRLGNGLICLFCGVRNEPMARAVLDGYASSTFNPNVGVWVRNDTFDALADAGQVEINQLQGLQQPSYTFVGHSSGGCVAMYLAARYKAENPDRFVQVVTFGSPRPGGERFGASLNGVQVTRIMYDLDPVPYIPYGVAELLGTINRYGTIRVRRFADFRQVGVGVVCDATRALRIRDVPEAAADELRSSFDAFMTGRAAQIDAAHGIARYASMTAAIAASQAPVSVPHPVNPPMEPRVSDSRARVTEATRQVTAVLRDASVISMNRVPRIPLAWRYRLLRQGNVYTVVQGDAVVSITGHRGQALATVRQGNEFVSQLLRNPFVHVEGVEEGFGGLLEAALKVPADFGLERLGDVDDLDSV